MATLTVDRALVSQSNPTEEQLDDIRTSLLTFFNAGNNLDEDNIQDGSMLYTSLGGSLSDMQLSWESDSATIEYVSLSEKFVIKNLEGSIIWAHREDDELIEFLELRSTDGALEVWGELTFNTSKGYQEVDLMWLLARYRKPKLIYTDDNIVTAEENGITASTSIVMMRDRLCTIVDRTLSLAVDANGETSGDTGAAVSGRAAGVARTANRWYYVYAVRVQYGDDNGGTKAILVAHTTSPESSNITTLNTAFGTGEWVYMGVIRNGWNDGVNTDVIVPFVYDEAGYMRFTKTSTAGKPGGVVLANTAASSSNLEYELVIGNAAAATIPPVATRVTFGGYREAYGFELHYRSGTDEANAIISGCWHITDLSTLTPVVYMEVPLLSGYKVVVTIGNVETAQQITLFGLLDHYR